MLKLSTTNKKVVTRSLLSQKTVLNNWENKTKNKSRIDKYHKKSIIPFVRRMKRLKVLQ